MTEWAVCAANKSRESPPNSLRVLQEPDGLEIAIDSFDRVGQRCLLLRRSLSDQMLSQRC